METNKKIEDTFTNLSLEQALLIAPLSPSEATGTTALTLGGNIIQEFEVFIYDNYDELMSTWIGAGLYKYIDFIDYEIMKFKKGGEPKQISEKFSIEVEEVIEYLKKKHEKKSVQ